MKLTINIGHFMFQKTGLGYYTHHLLSQFAKIAPSNDYYLFDAVGGKRLYNMVKLEKNLSNIGSFNRIATIPFPFMTVARYILLIQKKLTLEATIIEESDIYFGTNFRGVFNDSFKTVITVPVT